MAERLGPEAYARVTLPAGFEVTDVRPGSRDVWVEIEGPRQPDAYREDATFPGGLSLYLPARYREEDVMRDLTTMYVVWALHEALEFTTNESGRRLADPHPTGEDAMWTWLRARVGRLLSDYRRRWPVEDGSTPQEDACERRT